MAGPKLELVAASKALKRYKIDRDDGPDWTDQIRVYKGKTHLAELSLDDEATEDVIVDGDLVVDGDVVNRDGDAGRQLVVVGSLEARSLIAGGSYIEIRGNATLERGVYAHYNHGSLEIKGTLKAPFIVSSDHMTALGKTADTVTISWRSIAAQFDDDSITEILVPEVLVDGHPHDRAIFDRLANGQPIIIPNVVPPAVRLKAALEAGGKQPLRTLDLRWTKLRGFPSDKQLPVTLEVLELEGNAIRKLPSSIKRLQALRVLGLGSTSLESIDDEIAALPCLEELDLRYIEGDLPPRLPGSLRELEIHIAGHRDPLRIPAELLALPNLEHLELGAKLTRLPPEVTTLPKLESLLIKENAFSTLPALTLPRLNRLEISAKTLSAPIDFTSLPALRHLELDGDGNPDVLASVWQLSKLQTLSITGWDALTEFPDQLRGFSELRAIDVRFTGIEFLEIEKLLAWLPKVSVRIDDSDWPKPASAPKVQKLLDATNIHNTVWSEKGPARQKLMLTATNAALAALDQIDPDKYPYDAARARYAALRYGIFLLEDPKLPAKERARLPSALVELSQTILTAFPHKVPVRSAASTYHGTVRAKAAAVLALHGLQTASTRAAREAALAHTITAAEDSDYYRSTAASRARIELLIALGRFDDAAHSLRELVGRSQHHPDVLGLRTAPWYGAASSVTP